MKKNVKESSWQHFLLTEILGEKHKWFTSRETVKPKKKKELNSVLLTFNIYSTAFKKNELLLCTDMGKIKSENSKLWNNICDRISHVKFETDKIAYIWAEKKSQGKEHIPKSQ